MRSQQTRDGLVLYYSNMEIEERMEAALRRSGLIPTLEARWPLSTASSSSTWASCWTNGPNLTRISWGRRTSRTARSGSRSTDA